MFDNVGCFVLQSQHTFKSIISLFFFSMSCFNVASADTSAALASPSELWPSSFFSASVDCHLRSNCVLAVGTGRNILEAANEENGEDLVCAEMAVLMDRDRI